MREYVLFDFDGTVTTRDTVRYLLLELLRCCPWRVFGVAPLMVRMALCRSAWDFQFLKNRCIGYLIKGFSLSRLEPALERFNRRVQPLVRNGLLGRMQAMAGKGQQVVLASASPGFVLRYFFAGEDWPVIGTEFELEDGRFTGRFGEPCYGEEKARAVGRFLAGEGEEQGAVAAAWSDCFSDMPFMALARERVWVCSPAQVDRSLALDPGGSFVDPQALR